MFGSSLWIEDIDTNGKKDAFLEEHGDGLIDQGFSNPYGLTVENKGKLMHILKKNYLYYRTAGEIVQFTTGMNEVGGSWDFVKEHAQVLKPLFCHNPKQILSAEEMATLFHISFSDQGSNARAFEDVTVYGWEVFLQSIEGKKKALLRLIDSGGLHVPTGHISSSFCYWDVKTDCVIHDEHKSSAPTSLLILFDLF